MEKRESGEPRARLSRFLHSSGDAVRSLPAWLRWGAGTVAALLAVLFVVSYFLDEPFRRSMETRINKRLKGYSVRVPYLHYQLVGLSLTLKGLTVFQDANPDPPIAHFPVVHFGIHWREILAGRLVAELELDRPDVVINLQQLRTEAVSKVKLSERGWQEAVEAIYPFKINALAVHDGKLTYIDEDRDRPLRLSRLTISAGNIRNVRLPDKVYPSSFRLETAIFGTGRGTVEGKANLLAEPYPGVNARIKLENVPLEYFAPVIARTNLSIRKGQFSGSGRIEYAPNVKVAHLEDLTIRNMDIDYVHTAQTAEAEKERAEEVAEAVKEAGKSELLLHVDRLRFADCAVGLVNKAAKNPYRVFLEDADLRLTNLSNRFSKGPAEAELRGRFMGSGATAVTAKFRPEERGPDLDLRIKIEETHLTDMNDLLRAYGKFDVSGGSFSFFSELRIQNDTISGYVKPFFKNIKVFDRRTDGEKRAFRQLYEMAVGGTAKLLESRRGEVAAKAKISGPLSSPRISSWQIVGQVVKNAFFKRILPEFESQVSRPPGK